MALNPKSILKQLKVWRVGCIDFLTISKGIKIFKYLAKYAPSLFQSVTSQHNFMHFIMLCIMHIGNTANHVHWLCTCERGTIHVFNIFLHDFIGFFTSRCSFCCFVVKANRNVLQHRLIDEMENSLFLHSTSSLIWSVQFNGNSS